MRVNQKQEATGKVVVGLEGVLVALDWQLPETPPVVQVPRTKGAHVSSFREPHRILYPKFWSTGVLWVLVHVDGCGKGQG